MEDMISLFRKVLANAHANSASDVHLSVGSPWKYRIGGKIVPVKGPALLTPDECEAIVCHILQNTHGVHEQDLKKTVQELQDFDCSYSLPGISRFRVNICRQRGTFSVVLRIVPFEIPTVDSLGLPAVIRDVAMEERTSRRRSTAFLRAMPGLPQAEVRDRYERQLRPFYFAHNADPRRQQAIEDYLAAQMAEALLGHLGAGRFEAASGGSHPADRVSRLAVETLREHGIEWGGRFPKPVEDFEDEPWDLVVTVCEHAREHCPVFYGAGVVAHWGMPDPGSVEDPKQRQAAFREAFQVLRGRLERLIALPLESLDPAERARAVEAIGLDT